MDQEKISQEEIDRMVEAARRQACEHFNKKVIDYGPDFNLIHCKDCGHMYTEPKGKK